MLTGKDGKNSNWRALWRWLAAIVEGCYAVMRMIAKQALHHMQGLCTFIFKAGPKHISSAVSHYCNTGIESDNHLLREDSGIQ